MKLTKSKLKQVIEEEIQNTLQEGPADWWSSQEHPKMHGGKKPPDLQQLKDNLRNALTALLDHVIAVGVGGGGLQGGETEPALAEKDMLNIVEELLEKALQERTVEAMHGYMLQTPEQQAAYGGYYEPVSPEEYRKIYPTGPPSTVGR